MAHEITIREDGTAEAMFAEKPAWHGLGAVVSEAPTSQEALKLAGLDWEVQQNPMYALFDKDGVPTRMPVEDYLCNMRSDNQQVLGVVGTRYHVIQNREAFQFLDELHMDGVIRYESAFSLNGGKRVAIMARMPEVDVVGKGDEIARYMLFTTNHDGFGSIRIFPTAIRVVCANTLAVALSAGRQHGVALRHTSNLKTRLKEAQKVLRQSNDAFTRFAQKADELAAQKLKKPQFNEFLQALLPVAENDTDRRKKNVEEERKAIADIYHNHSHAHVNGIDDSWWAAINSVTQYVDHKDRTGRQGNTDEESRFNVTQFGAGYEMKQKAWEIGLELAATA